MKKIKLRGLLLSLTLAFAGCQSPNSVAEGINPGRALASGTYTIKSVESGLFLSVPDANNGTLVVQQSLTGVQQQWAIVDLGTGYFRVDNVSSAKALDVKDHSTADGGLIQQWAYGGGNNQQWQIIDLGAGQCEILSRESGKSLDVKDHSTSAGGQIQQWAYGGGANQKWIVALVGSPTPTPTPAITPTPTPVGQGTVSIWLTKSADQSALLALQPAVNFGNSGSASYTINVDDATSYQQMDGFGASMTEASAVLIQKMTSANQTSLLNQLFDANAGIGISFLRQPMGACDFNLSFFTYDDVPGDTNLNNFSIARDLQYTIPLLKKALAINPSLKIMGTPWSPPGWMKTGNSILGNGGVLQTQYYGAYANYFVKFVQAYAAQGLPIYMVTPQNEPAYGPTGYPGMNWTPAAENTFVKNNLGPALRAAGLGTKIAAYDHNWDNLSYAQTMLGDSGTSSYLAGSAWHYYGGTPDAMTTIHNQYPGKDIWFTEGGNGNWIGGGTFAGTFKDGIRNAIRITRNWSKSVVWWNVALNQNNGPNNINFPADPYTPNNQDNFGLVQINSNTGALTTPFRSGYYTLGHLSKFVKPGAYHVASPTWNDDVETVAFKNPDGSKVLLVSNQSSTNKTIKIVNGSNTLYYTLPGDATITFKW